MTIGALSIHRITSLPCGSLTAGYDPHSLGPSAAAQGPKLLKACRALHGCETGDAKITRGFDLPAASFVIHTVGPIGEKPALLRSCYTRCLDVALANGVRTIAFSGISTGVYGYPHPAAARVACVAVRDWMEAHRRAGGSGGGGSSSCSSGAGLSAAGAVGGDDNGVGGISVGVGASAAEADDATIAGSGSVPVEGSATAAAAQSFATEGAASGGAAAAEPSAPGSTVAVDASAPSVPPASSVAASAAAAAAAAAPASGAAHEGSGREGGAGGGYSADDIRVIFCAFQPPVRDLYEGVLRRVFPPGCRLWTDFVGGEDEDDSSEAGEEGEGEGFREVDGGAGEAVGGTATTAEGAGANTSDHAQAAP